MTHEDTQSTKDTDIPHQCVITVKAKVMALNKNGSVTGIPAKTLTKHVLVNASSLNECEAKAKAILDNIKDEQADATEQ